MKLPVRDPIKQIYHGSICRRRQITKGVPVLSACNPVKSFQNRRKPQLIGINLHVFFRLKKQKVVLGHQIRHPGNCLLIGFRIGVAHSHPENADSDHKQHRCCRQPFDRYLFQNSFCIQKDQNSQNKKNKYQIYQYIVHAVSGVFPIKIRLIKICGAYKAYGCQKKHKNQ